MVITENVGRIEPILTENVDLRYSVKRKTLTVQNRKGTENIGQYATCGLSQASRLPQFVTNICHQNSTSALPRPCPNSFVENMAIFLSTIVRRQLGFCSIRKARVANDQAMLNSSYNVFFTPFLPALFVTNDMNN